MNDDPQLRTSFARQRRRDHENAPAWRPELLCRPPHRPRPQVRWLPVSLAAACVVAMAVFLRPSTNPTPQLGDLPPLLDSQPAELFASLPPSFTAFEAPSDFLLPTHLQFNQP